MCRRLGLGLEVKDDLELRAFIGCSSEAACVDARELVQRWKDDLGAPSPASRRLSSLRVVQGAATARDQRAPAARAISGAVVATDRTLTASCDLAGTAQFLSRAGRRRAVWARRRRDCLGVAASPSYCAEASCAQSSENSAGFRCDVRSRRARYVGERDVQRRAVHRSVWLTIPFLL